MVHVAPLSHSKFLDYLTSSINKGKEIKNSSTRFSTIHKQFVAARKPMGNVTVATSSICYTSMV